MQMQETAKSVPQEQIETCCALVDANINWLGRNQLPSDSLHKAKIRSRTTIRAAQRIIAYAEELRMPLSLYILAALDSADKKKRARLTISLLSSKEIRKEVTQTRQYKDKLDNSSVSLPMHVKQAKTTGGSAAVLASIHTVMDNWYEMPVGTVIALLVGMRTVLDPVLLYSVPQIRELVDHDALHFLGISRATMRSLLPDMLRNERIIKTPEWRWWLSHIPSNPTRKKAVCYEEE